jgi:hypothetical protein
MFDTMIAPLVIKILYWIGEILVIVYGVTLIGKIELFGYSGGDASGEFFDGVVGGFIFIILGTIVLRLIFEILIVQFKTYESINRLKNKIKRK